MIQMVPVPWPLPWEVAGADAIMSGRHLEHLERKRLSRIPVRKSESLAFLFVFNLRSFPVVFKVLQTSSCSETTSYPEPLTTKER